jgi:site-specific DNA-methyltransferase (adenine-specific)
MNYTLYKGDCLTEMNKIKDHSIDMILVDPPYGTTPLHWDSIIDFGKVWQQYHRIAKPNTAIVIFAQEPFASFVRMSNIKEYRYDWYWEKERLTNVFQVKHRPGKTVENVIVFYRDQCIYNPQKHEHLGPPVKNKVGENARWSVTLAGYEAKTKPFEYIDNGTRHPTQILNFNRDNPRKRLHPTQKPVSLLEYLIKTYTDEGMTVLDNCMGSGSTGVACINTNRNFIGIELDDKYFQISDNRLKEVMRLKNESNSAVV